MKRNSIRLMTCLVLCGLMVSAATAQDTTKAAPRRGANIDQRIERLDKELALSADQKTKLKTYYEGVRKKNQDMRADNPTREQRQERVRVAREDLSKEMKSILTVDQFSKWEKNQDKRREEMKQRAKQGGKKAEEKTEK